ncbi:MAG: GIY-YIG nuclease family protein [Lachnospiraceae bacterium]|nr:GIY-YIG nuclease family protein [Lachnospiraceae bacterium]MDD6192233.1 GIY-YIG nuclease family protein [Lachnospiraceae bacterium]MDY4792809.1 GIY-YIG nuclease family protein [Pararoseburia sp.]
MWETRRREKDTEEKKSYYTYIVRCADDTLYTGFTTDVTRRVQVHNQKKGAKYTKTRTPVTLVYYEEFETKQLALKREAAIKKLTRQEKLKLIDRKRNEDD